MRTKKELLTLLAEHIGKDVKLGRFQGMCSTAFNLYMNNLIPNSDYITLKQLIHKAKPTIFSYRWYKRYHFEHNYYWPTGLAMPRLKWIKKQIKKEDEKSK